VQTTEAGRAALDLLVPVGGARCQEILKVLDIGIRAGGIELHGAGGDVKITRFVPVADGATKTRKLLAKILAGRGFGVVGPKQRGKRLAAVRTIGFKNQICE
jgi:hypothetical protein